MEYLAIYEKQRSSASLSRDEQMEEHLSRGANIYQVDGDDMTLIATPEQGFLIKRPTFPVPTTASFGLSAEMLQALKVLMSKEGEKDGE